MYQLQRSATVRDVNFVISRLVKRRVGEVQGRPEEDPQACDRHGWVSVHAAQPEHQQTVQPGKTSSACNPLTFPPRKLLGVSLVSVRPLWFIETCLNSAFPSRPPSPHTAVTINMLQIIDHLMDLSTPLHHPNIHYSVTSSGGDPYPSHPWPFDPWPSHAITIHNLCSFTSVWFISSRNVRTKPVFY